MLTSPYGNTVRDCIRIATPSREGSWSVTRSDLLASFSFRRLLIISAIVYRYGLTAELMGRTKVTDHANTDGGSVKT